MDKEEFEKAFEAVSADGDFTVYLELRGGGILVVKSCVVTRDDQVFISNGKSMGHIPLKLIKGVY